MSRRFWRLALGGRVGYLNRWKEINSNPDLNPLALHSAPPSADIPYAPFLDQVLGENRSEVIRMSFSSSHRKSPSNVPDVQTRAANHRWESTSAGPPPADGRLDLNRTSLLRTTRESSLKTPGIKWTDDGPTSASDIGGGRETRKMNTYQAIRDAMSIILTKDDTAVVFGEDVGFGGVFRCTLGLAEEFGRERVFNTSLTEYVICASSVLRNLISMPFLSLSPQTRHSRFRCRVCIDGPNSNS